MFGVFGYRNLGIHSRTDLQEVRGVEMVLVTGGTKVRSNEASVVIIMIIRKVRKRPT